MLTLHLIFSKRITGPIMMPFYQAMGLNFSQIGALSSTTWLADAFLEIPGGSFSDTYGRRRASILYAILGMASMAIYFLSSSLPLFFLASAIYGLALAVGGGNASAMLFDTLKILKLEKQYKKFRGRIQFPPKVINGLAILFLPFIYSQNIRLPFILGLIFYFVSFATALFLVEPRKGERRKKSIYTTSVSSIKKIYFNPELKYLIALQLISSGFLLLGFEYFQAIFKNAGIPLIYFGLIYAGARLVEGTGSLIIHKLEYLDDNRLICMLFAILIVAILGFGYCRNWYVLIFIALHCLVDGGIDVTLSHFINKVTTNTTRTTILSAANVVSALFFSGLLFAMGHLSDAIGVNQMFVAAALILSLLFITAGKINPNVHGTKRSKHARQLF